MTAKLEDARVLVTGASGFIGRHLCRRLRGLGAEVHGAARGHKAPEGVDVEWRAVDLAAPDAAGRLLDEVVPDVVFHLASLVTGGRDRNLVWPAFEANLVTTLRLLSAAAERGRPRVVLAGSLEEPVGSAAPCSPYAAAKAAASVYGRMFAELYGLPVTIARIFMVYGPGPQDPAKLVPYVIRELLAGRSPKLSRGLRPVDWIYVEDAVDGLVRMAVTADAVGRELDFGSGELVTVSEVVQRLFRIAGGAVEPAFGALPDRAGEVVRRAELANTEAVLGWRPQTALDEGLRRTVEWFREHPEAEPQRSAPL